jgi:anti-sigma regulatory factor (Ser/Thr protein kinase)
LQPPFLIAVTEPSQVGEARRATASLTTSLGFDETGRSRAAIVATEAASNLAKHGRDGVLLLLPLQRGKAVGVDILALDKGPGIADVSRCWRDGFSTAGTPGTGLGAVARLSAFADMYSCLSTGTALLARLWSGAPPPVGRKQLHHAAICLPKQGETVCGDAWAMKEEGGVTLCLVADGLGHGPSAADAARVAVRVFLECSPLTPVEALQRIHLALRGTRGAAVAVAAVDIERAVVHYASIGNITATVVTGGATRSLMSHNGTVGHEARKFQELSYPFSPSGMLVMHSDGLATRWTLDAYPGLSPRDPALIAGVLFRDFQRGRDDVTVLVARAPMDDQK